MNIRTRIAPSPTGFLHVGTMRTALFAWLLAKKANGEFILRIEDTDKNREVEGSIAHIIKSLKALGLNYDEGPDVKGPYGPYLQSDRLEIYKKWALNLVAKGRAYPDPYTTRQIEEFREEARINKKPFLYRNYRPDDFNEWDGTKALRFKSDSKPQHWNDIILGKLSAGPEAVDDFILIKEDGFPTYNFAHIIDDHLMKISHIIRSQEFTASVPRFLNLYEALEITPPTMATVPPVLGPDGKKKLSKRDGAKDVLEYLEEGYLKEALINFMATLGWNDGSTQEIYSVEELIQKFDIAKVQKSGAHFDDRRLLWMNGAHIRNLSIDKLYELTKQYLPKEALNYDLKYQKNVLALIQERLKLLTETEELTSFFFSEPKINIELISSHKQLSKYSLEAIKKLLEESKETLNASDFSVKDITKRLNDLLIETQTKPVELFSLIRIATTHSPQSPGLFDTLNLLGREVTIKRINETIQKLVK